jgi:RNA-binding protein 26
VEITPKTTHVTFKERRTAEAFLSTVNSAGLPGLDVKVEATWVPTGTPSLLPSSIAAAKSAEGPSASRELPKKAEDGVMEEMRDASPEAEEGEVPDEEPHRDHMMDYDVADDEQWEH